MDKLSVIGLGKLGACTAACFASKGYEVVGVDISEYMVNCINEGKAPVVEPDLQELIDVSKERLRATHDFSEAITCSDITLLIVPTPSMENGHFSDEYLLKALKPLSEALKESDKDDHLFVITSTVSPGTTENSIIPFIEKHSGKKLNQGFTICYNPEFIALGSVVKNFLNPDMVLIGESCEAAGERLAEIYRIGCENDPYIARMSLISGEIAKISLNAYVTMKISFANTLANLCEKIPGAQVDLITKALGADKRVSPYYIKGGLSFGGPCFPRDNRAFEAFAKIYDYEAKLAITTDQVNQYQIDNMINRISSYIKDHKSNEVAILGLAYKPDTPVIEESPSIKLINELLNHDIKVIAYDPLAMDSTKEELGDKIEYAGSVKECFEKASVVVVAVQIPEFNSIDESYIVNDPTLVIDCWRNLDPAKLGSKVKYAAIGQHS